MQSHRGRFDRGHVGGAHVGGGVEGRGHRERHGVDRAHAVNDVEAEDERDVETRLLDSDALGTARGVSAPEAEERSELPFAHLLLATGVHGGSGLRVAGGGLRDLSEFFLEGHEREE